MFMEYWVDLGINIWKNGRKTHILGIFGGLYRYTFGHVLVQPSRTKPVPVQVLNRCGTSSRTEPVPVQVRAVLVQVVLCFFVLTSVCILAITCSFLIRIE